MKIYTTTCAIAVLMLAFFTQCNDISGSSSSSNVKAGDCDTCLSYAIFAEYARDSNKPMLDSLNRRVFNDTEAIRGNDITLQKDGSITLQPGTYHISGFSMVTMETSMNVTFQNENYPGYCLVYPKQYEKSREILQKQIGIGSPATSDQCDPSIFDLVYHCDTTTDICVGHQAGNSLPKNKIFLSVYKVDTTTSDYHVCARIVVMKMR